jgi:hypothetical protein
MESKEIINMGHNLISGCHKCKKQQYHFRLQENQTILPFYLKHKECIKENIANVVTVLDDTNEPAWTNDEREGGYKDENLDPYRNNSQAKASKMWREHKKKAALGPHETKIKEN